MLHAIPSELQATWPMASLHASTAQWSTEAWVLAIQSWLP
jgi:hypothetical protein